MKLSSFMHEELILLDLLSVKKEAIIRELIAPIIKIGIASSEEKLNNAILNREKLGSTAIGHGIAIPHAKHSSVKKKAIVFGRSERGCNFDSIDDKPVNLFFMIISPHTEPGPHLKMLARISRLLQDEDFRESLLTLSTARQIIEYIKAKETY